jgi:hypothetical protein
MNHASECETDFDHVGGDTDVDYLETIALLQEEVGRLEQELRWRDQGPSETASEGSASKQGEADPVSKGEAVVAREEVGRLEAELAGREETIGLLLDQLSRVEDAQAASRAEWDQVSGWLAELEQRVEGQDGDALLRLQERLTAQQQQAEELRRRAEEDRRGAEAQRQVYEGEIARLRAALAQDRTGAPAGREGDSERAAPDSRPDSEVIEALRSENLRLRAACEGLAKRSTIEPPESWEAKLAESLKERDALRRQVEQIQDERRREQLEHRAALAELQAQLSRVSLARPEPPEAVQGAETIPHARDEQLRFQALRQHLLDIHQQEAAERKQKQLIPRLSRLWGRTGPR